MTPATRPCAFCREEIAWRAARCPRCDELQPVPEAAGRERVAWVLAGAALALVTVATLLRLSAGPESAPRAVAESLRFLELGLGGCFLLFWWLGREAAAAGFFAPVIGLFLWALFTKTG